MKTQNTINTINEISAYELAKSRTSINAEDGNNAPEQGDIFDAMEELVCNTSRISRKELLENFISFAKKNNVEVAFNESTPWGDDGMSDETMDKYIRYVEELYKIMEETGDYNMTKADKQNVKQFNAQKKNATKKASKQKLTEAHTGLDERSISNAANIQEDKAITGTHMEMVRDGFIEVANELDAGFGDMEVGCDEKLLPIETGCCKVTMKICNPFMSDGRIGRKIELTNVKTEAKWDKLFFADNLAEVNANLVKFITDVNASNKNIFGIHMKMSVVAQLLNDKHVEVRVWVNNTGKLYNGYQQIQTFGSEYKFSSYMRRQADTEQSRLDRQQRAKEIQYIDEIRYKK